MKKGMKFYYLIGIFIISNLCFISAGTTNVTECGALDVDNEIYELNTSINSTFDCLIINATNVTLDCKNYNVTYGNATGGGGIMVFDEILEIGFNNVTIKNCYLIQNESGINGTAIFLGPKSNKSVIYNNTIETYGNNSAGIALEEGSSNTTISVNYIYTNGTDSSGILLNENGINATIGENLIVTLGNISSGILIGDGSYNSTIYNNTIFNFGNRTTDKAMGGILLETNTFNLNVGGNYIIMGGYYGLFDYYVDTDVTIDDILAGIFDRGGYDSAGIWVWGDNITIDDNLIVTFGELGDGIYLNGVEGINITLNLIVTFGEVAHGVHSQMSEDDAIPNLIYNNLIGTLGDNSSCIYLNQSSNNSILSNVLGTFGEYSYGIFFNQSHTTIISGNEIATNDSTSYVLYLVTSAGESVYNNLFNTSTSDSGVYVETSSSSNFNTTKTAGTNIVEENYIGGNYWANVNSNGYSDYCANWDDDYICDSAYTVYATDFIDYLPLTSHINITSNLKEENPSGGSSGYPTFKPTEEELKKGYTKELLSNWKVLFNIENASHTFKVELVNITNAKISISSETQEATLSIGGEKKFEVSGDNYYDILVKLNSINLGKANFTIQTIQKEMYYSDENKIEQTEKNTDDSLNEGNGITKNYSLLKWTLSIVLFILIGFAIYKIFNKYKKNSGKKYVYK